MSRTAITALLALSTLLLGCGDGGEGSNSGADQRAVKAAIQGSNQAFADGDYAATCSYYTDQEQEQIAGLFGVKQCERAWRALNGLLRLAFTKEEVAALTTYQPESVEIDGDSATANYGEPPQDLPAALASIAGGTTIELEREDGEWLISSTFDPSDPGDDLGKALVDARFTACFAIFETTDQAGRAARQLEELGFTSRIEKAGPTARKGTSEGGRKIGAEFDLPKIGEEATAAESEFGRIVRAEQGSLGHPGNGCLERSLIN